MRLVVAFIALIASLGLLAADSAEPLCDDYQSLPDELYNFKFKCPDIIEGQLRHEVSYAAGDWSVDAELVSGEAVVSDVSAYGSCAEEGGTARPTELIFTIDETSCSVDLDRELGLTIECIDHTVDAPCTFKIWGGEQ